jgi:tetratricopeptide repeat protein
MDFLAKVYASEGKYSEARALYTKVLDMRLRVLGKDHPDTQETLRGLEALRR